MRKVIDLSEFISVPTAKSVEAEISERFKKRRKERKISRAKLSKLSGVSYASIRRFEETGQISLTSLLELSETMNCLDDFKKLFSTSYIRSLKDYIND